MPRERPYSLTAAASRIPEKDEKSPALFLRCTVSGDLRRDHEDRTEKHDRNEGEIVISESRSQRIVPGNPSEISRDV